jgi:methylmalonyl-CoA mutase cobalamin-binding subunit
MALVPEVMRLLREERLDNVMVIFGGTVPPDDIPKL